MNYEELKKFMKKDMEKEELEEFADKMYKYNGEVIKDQASAKLSILRMNKDNLKSEEYKILLGLTIGV